MHKMDLVIYMIVVKEWKRERAIYWYPKAVINGNTMIALNNLGEYYELGIGAEKDEIKAIEYYKKSVESGASKVKFTLDIAM